MLYTAQFLTIGWFAILAESVPLQDSLRLTVESILHVATQGKTSRPVVLSLPFGSPVYRAALWAEVKDVRVTAFGALRSFVAGLPLKQWSLTITKSRFSPLWRHASALDSLDNNNKVTPIASQLNNSAEVKENRSGKEQLKSRGNRVFSTTAPGTQLSTSHMGDQASALIFYTWVALTYARLI